MIQEFEADVRRRMKNQPDEHPLVSRLVVLRVILNHEFGAAFEAFDHELAQLEIELQNSLDDRS